jgi:glycosyltransferase involved in cell wall biosynthesis
VPEGIRMGEMISIVISTKNSGNMLEQCLSSIERLDYPEDEKGRN